jgi:capsular polysaccharide biosynthesis protein
MESNFDLTAALAQWRGRLSNQPGISADTLAELESHLMDGVAELRDSGLSSEEAFHVASSRLGTAEELGRRLAEAAGNSPVLPAAAQASASASPPPMPVGPSPVPRRNGCLLIVRLGCVLLILCSCAFAIFTAVLPTLYVGRVKLLVHHERPGPSLASNWPETEIKLITSQAALGQVVARRNLMTEWNLPDEAAAIDHLQRMVEVTVEQEAEIIHIEVYSPNPKQAAELANAVADAYEEVSKVAEIRAAVARSAALQAESEAQDKLVEEKRQVVLGLARKYGIVDVSSLGTMPFSSAPSQQNGSPRSFDDLFGDLAKRQDQILVYEAQLNVTKGLEGDALLASIENYGLGGAAFKALLSKYRTLRAELNGLKQEGVGDRHPRVLGLGAAINWMGGILFAEADTVRKELETSVAFAKTAMEKLKTESKGAYKEHAEEILRRAEQSEYIRAKIEYEREQQRATELHDRILKEKVSLIVPPKSIQRLENAFPDPNPARPNKRLHYTISAGCAVLGLVLLLLSFLARREGNS